MTGPSAEEQLRAQVRAALKASGRKQVWIANKLGISPKHLSQMLTGRVSLTLDWAQQIAVLCDARVLVFVTAPPGTPDREHRIRLDDLNSDDLDRLYDDLDRYAEVVSEMNEALTQSARDLAALRQVARGYCPACGRGDRAERERDTARQHAAAIAAQRDRLRQRMNTLADRWETALPGQPHHGFAKALREEISVAPFHDTTPVVQQYRTDDGSQKWAVRCWGTDTCDGFLSLDHDTEQWAKAASDRHLAEAHTALDTPEPTP